MKSDFQFTFRDWQRSGDGDAGNRHSRKTSHSVLAPPSRLGSQSQLRCLIQLRVGPTPEGAGEREEARREEVSVPCGLPPGRVVVMPSGKFDGDRFDVEEVRVEAVAVERK